MKKKRDKRSRLRGRKTCGYGARKKHRGSGHRGGKGMAGSGKKAGQRKVWLLKYMPNYLGKKGFVSKKKKLKIINLDEIEERIKEFEERKIAKRTAEGIGLDLREYKVLGAGEVKSKLIIKAENFSESAKEKIEEKGGKAIVISLEKT